VAEGIDLPVVNICLRYHVAVTMGEAVDVLTRLVPPERLRLNWEYEIRTTGKLCVSAQVSLVAIDRSKGKVMRSLPPILEQALERIAIAQSK
jgi:acyl-CoA thioester hydrolase